MRRFILLAILLVSGCGTGHDDEPARGAEVLWARTWGGGDEDRVSGMAVMRDGSVLTVGYAYGDVQGAFESPGTHRDVMLVRFDGNGDLVPGWPKRFGAGDGAPEASSRQANAVAIGPDGDIYIAGDYKGWLQLGGTLLQTSSDADVDAYVARLSQDGDVKWVQNIAGVGWTTTTSIVADQRGVVVSGFFDGHITFAGQTINKMDMDGYIAQLDVDGTPKKLVTYGGSGHDELHSLAFDPRTGHYIAAGSSDGSHTIYGPLDPEDPRDVLVLELSDDMEIATSPHYGGAGQEQAWAVAVDDEADTQLAIVGELSSGLDLDGVEVAAGDDLDGFAVGFGADDAPTVDFAFRGPGRQAAKSVALVDDGSLVVGGWGSGTMDFGAAEGPYEALGETDAFVALLAPDGTLVELNPFGDAGIDTADAVAVADADTYYAAGMFGWYMALDDTLAPGSVGDAWIAKLHVTR